MCNFIEIPFVIKELFCHHWEIPITRVSIQISTRNHQAPSYFGKLQRCKKKSQPFQSRIHHLYNVDEHLHLTCIYIANLLLYSLLLLKNIYIIYSKSYSIQCYILKKKFLYRSTIQCYIFKKTKQNTIAVCCINFIQVSAKYSGNQLRDIMCTFLSFGLVGWKVA